MFIENISLPNLQNTYKEETNKIENETNVIEYHYGKDTVYVKRSCKEDGKTVFENVMQLLLNKNEKIL